MRVILRNDVDGLGRRGDVCDVADGYAKNYLVPHGLAMRSNAGAERQAETMRQTRELKEAKEIKVAQEMATRVVGSTVHIAANAGEGGRLFGSVTSSDVVRAVQEQLNITIDRKVLVMDEAIKTLGSHMITAKIHPEVEFPVSIEVVEA